MIHLQATGLKPPPPATERLAELQERLAALLTHAQALAVAAVTPAVLPDDSYLRSARAAEQDVAATIAKMERLGDQAAREYAVDNYASMEYTLSVLNAVLRGEFVIRVRAWADAERGDDRQAFRATLRAWADDLEQETPLCG